MRPQLLFRKIHKWMGLILFIQILFWFISGFLMSWMPIEEVRGNHLLKPTQNQPLSLDGIDLRHIQQSIKGPIDSLNIKPWLGQTVIEVEANDQQHLFETSSMKLISPLSEEHIVAIVEHQILPQYEITAIKLLSEVPNEARGREGPLWQVVLSGGESPRIYISGQNGEIVAKRTNRWRIFDFVWMLHIMDYDEREDFNHPLLYLTALSALLFTLSGLVLLFFVFKRKKKP